MNLNTYHVSSAYPMTARSAQEVMRSLSEQTSLSKSHVRVVPAKVIFTPVCPDFWNLTQVKEAVTKIRERATAEPEYRAGVMVLVCEFEADSFDDYLGFIDELENDHATDELDLHDLHTAILDSTRADA